MVPSGDGSPPTYASISIVAPLKPEPGIRNPRFYPSINSRTSSPAAIPSAYPSSMSSRQVFGFEQQKAGHAAVAPGADASEAGF